MTPFLSREAERLGVSPSEQGHAMATWHLKQGQNSLGQLDSMAPQHRAQLAAYIDSVRASLHLALRAFDEAALEVYTAVGIPLPGYLLENAYNRASTTSSEEPSREPNPTHPIKRK